MATSGALTIRGEASAANAAQAGDGEGGALHIGGLELAVARQRGEIGQFLGDLLEALLVGVLITGTTSPLGVSAAKPMW